MPKVHGAVLPRMSHLRYVRLVIDVYGELEEMLKRWFLTKQPERIDISGTDGDGEVVVRRLLPFGAPPDRCRPGCEKRRTVVFAPTAAPSLPPTPSPVNHFMTTDRSASPVATRCYALPTA